RGERHRSRAVERDTLREFRKDPPDRTLVAGADEHPGPATFRDEHAPGHRAPLDHRREGQRAGVVERRHPEAREGAARGCRVALSDDLAERGARREVDRLDTLAPAADGREKRDIPAVVQRRRVEAGEGAGRDGRRRAPDDGHRPEAPPRGRKDPLHGFPARHGRRERDVTGLIERRASMLNRSNAPPPGAAWPATTTRWRIGDSAVTLRGRPTAATNARSADNRRARIP